MRRPFPVWTRPLLAVWGLWFVAALAWPMGLRSCPQHGVNSAHAGHMGHMAGMADGVHVAPGATTAQSSDEHSGQSGHQSGDCCTCFGMCCCATTLIAPARATDLPRPVVVDAAVATYPDVAAPTVRRAHALPFANGPPLEIALA